MPQKDTNKAVVQRPVDHNTEHTPKGINYLFVIAIDAYQNCPPLYNCIADAKQLIKVLTTKYFFEEKNLITLFDEAATEGNIFKSFRRLAKLVTKADNLIIYFSGHGEYDKVFREGYWIPVNAKLGAQEDFVSNSKIKTILEAIDSKHTFLIADSCFSGSLFTQFKSASVAERLENDPSRWGLTAGRNEVVSDGKAGDHSPFADSLLYHLTNNEIPIGVATLCNRVVENVIASANQTPRGEPLKVSGHRGGQFFFHPRNAKTKLTPVGDKVVDKRGNVLYQIPEEMELNKDTKCIIRIAFEEVFLHKDLETFIEPTIKDIRVSNLMEVDLIDPLQQGTFQIRAINKKEQIIDKNDFTQWLFYVKAQQSGTFPLLVKVTLIEVFYGKERRKEIVLEETINVVTSLTETQTQTFKSAGYSLKVASKSANDGGTLIGGRVAGKDLPTTSPPIPLPKFSSKPKQRKSRARIITILGGMVAVLLFFVISKSTFLDDNQVEKGNFPKPAGPEAYVEPPPADVMDWQKRTMQRVTKNGKTGYIDRNTKEVLIPNQYDMGNHFKEGVAFVRLNNKWGLINKRGDIIVDFVMSQPGKFEDRKAVVFVGATKFVINPKGETKVNGKVIKLDVFIKRSKK